MLSLARIGKIAGVALGALAGLTGVAALTALRRPLARTSGQVSLPGLDGPVQVLRDRWVNHLEREYLRGVLARIGGNVSAAAEAAGLDRAYVYRLIRKYGL